MKIDVESIDLAELARSIKQRIDGPIAGPMAGRSMLRDAVAVHLGCSMLEAEELVDTMIARGFARLEHDDEGRQAWILGSGS